MQSGTVCRSADAVRICRTRVQAVLDWSTLTDFSQTAAVLDQLDLLDRGGFGGCAFGRSMGKPVWLLVPFLPDWRWQLAREDSDWYPSMRLFRQERSGDWAGVLQRVRQALQEKTQILLLDKKRRPAYNKNIACYCANQA